MKKEIIGRTFFWLVTAMLATLFTLVVLYYRSRVREIDSKLMKMNANSGASNTGKIILTRKFPRGFSGNTPNRTHSIKNKTTNQ